MSVAESTASDAAIEIPSSEEESDDRCDQDSQATLGSKRKRSGRPNSDAWETFKKVPNPNPGKSKRKWLGQCRFCNKKVEAKVEHLRVHASKCTEASPDGQLAAMHKQIKAGGKPEDSSQLSIDSYTDSKATKLSSGQNRALQRLLALAVIMCALPFACVSNPFMLHFFKCVRPSFIPPGTLH